MFCPVSPEEIRAQDESLRRLAQKLVQSGQAEDVVQDAWLAALERPPERCASRAGWFNAVTRYVASRVRRRDRLRTRSETLAARPESTFDAHADEEQRLLQLGSLLSHVERLREPYRTVVRLRYFEGLTVLEIAERLERPYGTVQSQVARALTLLREGMSRPARRRRTAWTACLVFLGLRREEAGARLSPGVLAGVAAAVLPLGLGGWLYFETRGARTPGLAAPALLAAAPDGAAPAPTAAPAAPLPALPRASLAPAPARLVIRALAEEDGAPVAGLALEAEREGYGDDPLLWSTDERGEVRSSELAPGAWRVTPARGLARRFVASAGDEEILTLLVPAGIDVEGRVVARVGTPLPGAELWVSWPGRLDRGRFAGHADEHGAFVLRGLDARSWLGARHERFVPSRIYDLSSPALLAEPAAEIVLALGDSARFLDGTVVDAAGRAVSGARVELAVRPLSEPIIGAGGLWLQRPPPEETRTDALGRFRLRRFNHPQANLTVRADGHAPWSQSVSGADVEVRLERPARAHGTVVDADGEPVAGAWVEVRQDRPLPLVVEARTDARGRFAVDGLAAGEGLCFAGDGAGASAVQRLSLADGAAPELRLPLGRATTVAGDLLDAAGRPLSGWDVLLEPEVAPKVPQPARLVRSVAGRFTFEACAELSYRASAFPPGAPALQPLAVALGVRPGADQVALRAATPEGRIVGTLAGAELQGVRLTLTSDHLTAALAVPLDVRSGRFESSELLPATYRLSVETPRFPAQLLAEVALLRRGVHSLGVLPLPAPGTLVARVSAPDAAALATLKVAVLSERGRLLGSPGSEGGIAVDYEGRVRVHELVAGAYSLLLRAPGCAHKTIPFRIHPGATTTLEPRLERGFQVPITVTTETPIPPGSSLRLVVTRLDGDGEVFDHELLPTTALGPFEGTADLPPGRFHVLATTDSGLRAEAEFVNDESHLTVALTLQ